MPICIIDGDLLCFKAAAANETRSIEATNKLTGKKMSFKHRTDMKESAQMFDLNIDDFDVKDVQQAEDISHALHTIKQMINNICETCKANKCEIYLSGDGNFRDELPLPQKYKGNREGMIKPLQLKEVKDYLINCHNAKVVKGEADDKIAMRQWESLKSKSKVIGCSTDKDSMGTDGWVYNWDKMKEPMFIKGLGDLYLDDKGKVRGHGNKWKYLQWIVGDSVDGLNPSYLAKVKFGEKGGYNLLKDLKTDKECWQAVYNLYEQWYPKPVTYTDQCGRLVENASHVDIAQVYFDAIHMQRFPDDRVDVAKIFEKMGIS